MWFTSAQTVTLSSTNHALDNDPTVNRTHSLLIANPTPQRYGTKTPIVTTTPSVFRVNSSWIVYCSCDYDAV